MFGIVPRDDSNLVKGWKIGVSAAFSAVVLVFLYFHTTVRGDTIDSTTLGLLALLLVGLLVPVLKSFTLPGGIGADMEGLAQAVKKTDKPVREAFPVQASASILSSPPEQPLWRRSMDEDPNVGLAILRFEIEKRVRSLVAKHFPRSQTERATLRPMLGALGGVGVLSRREIAALEDVVVVCNNAVHAQNVPMATAREIANLGVIVIEALDRKLLSPTSTDGGERIQQAVKAPPPKTEE